MALNISIRYPRPDISLRWPQIEIGQRYTTPEMSRTGPEVHIDQQQTFNEVGLGDYRHFGRTHAHKGMQEAVEGIARRSREGDRLAAEMTQQDTFVRISREENTAGIPDLNVDILPKTRPKVTFNYALDIHWNPGDVDVSIRTAPPHIQWTMGDVAVSSNRGQNLDVKG